MADKLVQWLNERGYQPIFIPATGFEPPELYVLSERQLVHIGALKNYLPNETAVPEMHQGTMPDIQIVQTQTKSLRGAVDFLGNALAVLGLSRGPALDLSLADTGDFVFSLTGVTYRELAPTEVAKLVKSLSPDLLPKKYASSPSLNVAYHYAYATQLEMRRHGNKKFVGRADGGKIENIMDVSGSASAQLSNGNTLTFKGRKSEPIAFAYRAAKLRQSGGSFELFSVQGFAKQAAEGALAPYIPARGQVLNVKSST